MHFTGCRFFLRSQIEDAENAHGARIDGNAMAIQRGLNHVGHDEAARTVHLFQPFDCGAKRLLALFLQVKAIELFEDGVQHALDAVGRRPRIWQNCHNLGKLGDRGHADFVPIEEGMFERGESFFGRFQQRVVLQHASKKAGGSSTVRSAGGAKGL